MSLADGSLCQRYLFLCILFSFLFFCIDNIANEHCVKEKSYTSM
jgi:hypothetical protein